jgi:hypothetical protein
MRRRVLATVLLVSSALTGLGVPRLATAATWQPGPQATLDGLSGGSSSYAGFVDQPAPGASVPAGQPLVVSGWVVDQTAQGWPGIDEVHIYDGLAGAGGAFLGRADIARARVDVAQALGNGYWLNSGFSASLPAGALGPGAHTLSVYAHTPSKGWWYTQVSIVVAPGAPPAPAPAAIVNAIIAPTASERVSRTLDHYTIRGYALDPSATTGTGIDRVQVYMDEPRGQGGTLVGEATFGGSTPGAAAQYGPHFAEAGYHVDIRPVDFTAGSHHVYAYARSSVSGQEALAIASFSLFNP